MMLLLLLLLSIGLIIYSTVYLKLHPFLALLLVAIFYGIASGMSFDVLVQSINEGFGITLGKIGIVIALGVIIGAFLEQTGGAYALAEKVMKITGKKNVSVGMALLGWIVSIPVFADSAFIVLTPLNKALTKKAGLSLSVTAIALAMGMLASHSLVPPTPGPIATAGILNADLGFVILGGTIISLLALIPILIFVKWYATRIYIDPNPDFDSSEVLRKTREAPSAFKSSLPIVLPILLIITSSFNNYLGWVTEGFYHNLISLLGTPVIALLIGLGFALLLPKKLEQHMISEQGWIGKALQSAAIILMITGAGGVFGTVLQHSGLADVLGQNLASANLGIWLPFIIAAALKTAQGSSTVAMITTASIVAPLMVQLGIDTEISKALAVLAIGAGACVVSHANDSYFWVVTQLSGMDISKGYRLHTLGSAVLGTSAFILILLAHAMLV